MNKIISDHYNKLGSNYLANWKKLDNGMTVIAEFEENFIEKSVSTDCLQKKGGLKILDIGCGPGRIADFVLNKENNLKYYGIDISKEMVNSVKNRFRNNQYFIDAQVCDASEKIPHESDYFDIIISIRVLKYNVNWKDIIKNINRVLKKGGYFIFTMPNKHSLNYFSKGEIPIYKTTISEITEILQKNGFNDIGIKDSSKLSDLFYSTTNNKNLIKFYCYIEKLLSIIFKQKYSRLLYIVCRKI